jgi:hypothetical protein
MMKATTETTKLNFMTDHGSTRERVSCACRLDERRTLARRLRLRPALRPWKADVTELASPAAAPPTADAAPAAEKPWPPAELAPGPDGRGVPGPGPDGPAPGADGGVPGPPGRVPVAVALNEAGAGDGSERGRTSRHSDDAPPGPVCGEAVDGAGGAAGAGDVAVSRESRDDGAVDDAVPDDAVPDDAVPDDVAVDDAVKVGRRSPGEKTEGPGAPEPELGGGGAMIEPPGTAGDACLGADDPVVPAWSESEASLFADGLNQLVVAAMACLTAWRPLSSTPLAVETRPSEWPSLSFGSAADPLLPVSDSVTRCAGPFFLPISSAGNGTRLEESSAAPPLWCDEAPFEAMASSDMTSFSVTASGALTSGSISRPGGATIRGGSGARPASSTPSSSVPKLVVPLCTFSRDYPTTDNLPVLSSPLNEIQRNPRMRTYARSNYP